MKHKHWFAFIYHFGCRPCEIARFDRILPGCGLPKHEIHQFVMESPALTAADKMGYIQKYGL